MSGARAQRSSCHKVGLWQLCGSCWFYNATELPHRSASGLLLHALAIMFSALAAALLGRTAVAMRFLDLFRFISAFFCHPVQGARIQCARACADGILKFSPVFARCAVVDVVQICAAA